MGQYVLFWANMSYFGPKSESPVITYVSMSSPAPSKRTKVQVRVSLDSQQSFKSDKSGGRGKEKKQATTAAPAAPPDPLAVDYEVRQQTVDRQIDRQTDKQTDSRQTDRQIDR